MATYINIPPVSTFDTWGRAQQALISQNAPTLTEWDYIKIGDVQRGVTLTATNDAALVGGGMSFTNVTGTMFTASVYQTAPTTAWGFVYRGIISPVSGATFNELGLSNAGNSHDVGITVNSADGISGVNYTLRIAGASVTSIDTGVVTNTNIHDFGMTFDGTTVKLFIDGVQKASTTTLTNLNAEPLYFYGFNTTSGQVKATKLLYGYIAP